MALIKKCELSQSRLKEVLTYYPDTGRFIRVSSNGAEKPCGYIDKQKSNSYRKIDVDGVRYYAHRLAWLYVHGVFPEFDIDHIDRDSTNNRLSNLRHIERKHNCKNGSLRKSNTSGFNGVHFDKAKGAWISQIKVDGKRVRCRQFKNKCDAIKERKKWNDEFGFSEQHGRKKPQNLFVQSK